MTRPARVLLICLFLPLHAGAACDDPDLAIENARVAGTGREPVTIGIADVLLAHGVTLAFGSGTAMFTPPVSLDGEIEALRQVPLTPAQLRDAMTIDAASALGREIDLGGIAVGKRADLVLVAAGFDATMAPPEIIMVIGDGRIVVDRRL